MCGIEEASLAFSAIGAITQTVGVLSTGYSNSSMYEYQAEVMERNRQIGEQQAQQAIARGELDKAELRQKLQLIRGEGRAAWGASGVVLGEGSPLDWQEDIAERELRDERTSEYNTQMEAWGYRIDAYNAGVQGAMSSAAAAGARRSSWMEAGGSLLAGASTVSDKYNRYFGSSSTSGLSSGGYYTQRAPGQVKH